MVVALAAIAAAEIELERDRVAHRRDGGLDRLLGDQRAAEIGVQHGAGEIEHRPQARARARFKQRECAVDGVATERAVRSARACAIVTRTASVVAARPWRSITLLAAGARIPSSTEGSLHTGAVAAFAEGSGF